MVFDGFRACTYYCFVSIALLIMPIVFSCLSIVAKPQKERSLVQ